MFCKEHEFLGCAGVLSRMNETGSPSDTLGEYFDIARPTLTLTAKLRLKMQGGAGRSGRHPAFGVGRVWGHWRYYLCAGSFLIIREGSFGLGGIICWASGEGNTPRTTRGYRSEVSNNCWNCGR